MLPKLLEDALGGLIAQMLCDPVKPCAFTHAGILPGEYNAQHTNMSLNVTLFKQFGMKFADQLFKPSQGAEDPLARGTMRDVQNLRDLLPGQLLVKTQPEDHAILGREIRQAVPQSVAQIGLVEVCLRLGTFQRRRNTLKHPDAALLVCG